MDSSNFKHQLENNILILEEKSAFTLGEEAMNIFENRCCYMPEHSLSSKNEGINQLLSVIQQKQTLYLTVLPKQMEFKVEFLNWDSFCRLKNYIWLDIRYYTEEINGIALLRLGFLLRNMQKQYPESPLFVQLARF